MNHLVIIGNLCADPELRTTQNGIAVCSFTVAVSRKRAGQDGVRPTDFFRVSAWRQLGENCEKFLSRGKKVAVTGEVTARVYTDKKGEARVSLEVTADEVEFLSPKDAEPAKEAKHYPAPLPDLAGFENISEDELPFK